MRDRLLRVIRWVLAEFGPLVVFWVLDFAFGLKVAIAARQTDKLATLAKETGAAIHQCNAADPKDVAALFDAADARGGAPDIVVYNASSRVRGSIVDLPPDDVKRAVLVCKSARSIH